MKCSLRPHRRSATGAVGRWGGSPDAGIGAVLVNISAAIAVHRDGEAPRGPLSPRAVPILAIGHLLTTAKAVPHMVRGRETGGPDSLQEALKSCWRWHLARTGIDAMTFAANLRLLMSVWQPEEYSEEVREAAIRPSRPLV